MDESRRDTRGTSPLLAGLVVTGMWRLESSHHRSKCIQFNLFSVRFPQNSRRSSESTSQVQLCSPRDMQMRPPWRRLWWRHQRRQGRGHSWLCRDLIWAIRWSWRSITGPPHFSAGGQRERRGGRARRHSGWEVCRWLISTYVHSPHASLCFLSLHCVGCLNFSPLLPPVRRLAGGEAQIGEAVSGNMLTRTPPLHLTMKQNSVWNAFISTWNGIWPSCRFIYNASYRIGDIPG